MSKWNILIRLMDNNKATIGFETRKERDRVFDELLKILGKGKFVQLGNLIINSNQVIDVNKLPEVGTE